MGLKIDNINQYMIEDIWLTPYIGRKVKNPDSDLWDDSYWEDLYPCWTGTIIHFEAGVNDEDILEDVSLSKYRDGDYGGGRPQTEELSYNSSDKGYFTRRLNEETESRAEFLLEDILYAGKELTDGWIVSKVTKAKARFEKNENAVDITLKKIYCYAEIFCSYIELAYLPEIWVANSKHLREEHMESMMALLSCIDTDKIDQYEERKKEARYRYMQATRVEGYKALCKAAEDNNTEDIIKYKDYNTRYAPCSESILPPLYFCIINNNTEGIDILLENGAKVTEYYCIEKNGKATYDTAIGIAIENKDTALFDKLINSKSAKEDGDGVDLAVVRKSIELNYPEFAIDHIRKKAKHQYVYKIPDLMYKFGTEFFVALSEIDNVIIDNKKLKDMLHSGETEAAKRAIKAKVCHSDYNSRICDDIYWLARDLIIENYPNFEELILSTYKPYNIDLLNTIRFERTKKLSTKEPFNKFESSVFEGIIAGDEIKINSSINKIIEASYSEFIEDIAKNADIDQVKRLYVKHEYIFSDVAILRSYLEGLYDSKRNELYNYIVSAKWELIYNDIIENIKSENTTRTEYLYGLFCLTGNENVFNECVSKTVDLLKTQKYNPYHWLTFCTSFLHGLKNYCDSPYVQEKLKEILNIYYDIFIHLDYRDFFYSDSGYEAKYLIEDLEDICHTEHADLNAMWDAENDSHISM